MMATVKTACPNALILTEHSILKYKEKIKVPIMNTTY
jgi:hypothetical protein